MSKLSKPKAKEYVKHKGKKCPHCDSKKLTKSMLNEEGQSAWRYVTCKECRKDWLETFTMTGALAVA